MLITHPEGVALYGHPAAVAELDIAGDVAEDIADDRNVSPLPRGVRDDC